MSDENDERVLKKLTVRELRARAAKSLGSKVAAGLKLKQELVDALVARAAKVVEKVEKAAPAITRKAPKKEAVPAKKEAEPAKKTNGTAKKAAEPAKKTEEVPAAPAPAPAPAKKSPPRKRANGARASAPRASAPKAARAAKEASPSPPTPPAAVAPKASAPKTTAKPSKSERLAQVYELPITRDFFVDPRRQALPVSYGDDRLLCFRREPLAIVVSWDLSAATFADGQSISLELVTGRGRLVGSVRIGAPTGLATFDTLPPGQALSVQVVRAGRVVTRGRPFMMGGTPQEDEGVTASQMTVPFDQPLPKQPERRAWEDAPARPGRTEWKSTKTVQAGSSRLAPETEEGAEERGARDRSAGAARRRASSSRFSS